ncbi:MAG: hypothetical protein IPH48_18765 [bacterium]|nr:hypothetical protein [bacterium]
MRWPSTRGAIQLPLVRRLRDWPGGACRPWRATGRRLGSGRRCIPVPRLLWHQGRKARPPEFSAQRTFDVSLFGARDLILIEAEIGAPFDVMTANVAREDRRRLPALFGETCPRIWLCALAPSRYLACGGAQAGAAFADVAISWRDTHQLYGDARLLAADVMGGEAGRLLGSSGLRAGVGA